MTRQKDIARLQELAGLMRDHRLSQLKAAATKRAQSLEQIAALDRPEGATDLPTVAENLVALRYQVWADHRRAELNIVLARQTVDLIEAQATARRAFGQAQALQGLCARLGRKV